MSSWACSPSRRRLIAAKKSCGASLACWPVPAPKGWPVVHVQHDGGPGHVLAKGSAGWPHHALVAPRPGEIVVEKRHSSSFHDTDLHRRLSDAGIDTLVIAGMQTEMCVDSACRGAVALGYRVVLVADGHTTWDTPVIDAERIIAITTACSAAASLTSSRPTRSGSSPASAPPWAIGQGGRFGSPVVSAWAASPATT